MEVNREAQERGEIEGEMMTSEPKPCPFCPPDLSDPAFVPYNQGVYSEDIHWKVRCRTCGCECGLPEATKEAALEVWNARPERTCKMEPDPDYDLVTCSECGYEEEIHLLFPPSGNQRFDGEFCPRCGAKVVNNDD